MGSSCIGSPLAARISRTAAQAVISAIGWRMAVSGGTLNLTIGVSSKLTIDRSSGAIFVTVTGTTEAAGSIVKLVKRGETFVRTVLATGEDNPGAIEVDDKWVYWAVRRNPGLIRRVAK